MTLDTLTTLAHIYALTQMDMRLVGLGERAECPGKHATTCPGRSHGRSLRAAGGCQRVSATLPSTSPDSSRSWALPASDIGKDSTGAGLMLPLA